MRSVPVRKMGLPEYDNPRMGGGDIAYEPEHVQVPGDVTPTGAAIPLGFRSMTNQAGRLEHAVTAHYPNGDALVFPKGSRVEISGREGVPIAVFLVVTDAGGPVAERRRSRRSRSRSRRSSTRRSVRLR
jgi:hypothetical protein